MKGFASQYELIIFTVDKICRLIILLSKMYQIYNLDASFDVFKSILF